MQSFSTKFGETIIIHSYAKVHKSLMKKVLLWELKQFLKLKVLIYSKKFGRIILLFKKFAGRKWSKEPFGLTLFFESSEEKHRTDMVFQIYYLHKRDSLKFDKMKRYDQCYTKLKKFRSLKFYFIFRK